jgi:3-hydroxyisobutyrate dehydrogenase-like beta-hydroxyacid dehydrogenase
MMMERSPSSSKRQGILLSERTSGMSPSSTYHITVVGIGAMGGGMARALLDSPVSRTVSAFDLSAALTRSFWEEAREKNKCLESSIDSPPRSLAESVHSKDTQIVLVVLQTEEQCEHVCFGRGPVGLGEGGGGGGAPDPCLLDLVPRGSCVAVASTVAATWMRGAAGRFRSRGVGFVDGPVSGGAARARAGDLVVMASASSQATLDYCRPVLDALARQVFVIEGGVGMASTVKMVHQLLAGVHVCVAAEAMSLAVSAGVDLRQLYEIVTCAAGNSWMFGDRAPRMMERDPEVRSALDIFAKDLGIVHRESGRLRAPVPVASAALQQFVAGQGLGLGELDDSQVVRVYERITGASVSAASKGTPSRGTGGNEVGDLWRFKDGSTEEILEVGSEPRHRVVIDNEFVRAIRVEFPPGDTTLAHRHDQDSIYFYVVGLDVINHVMGSDPVDDTFEFGEIRYGTHKTDRPLVHKITNKSPTERLVCVDAEVLKPPPAARDSPMVADKHELVKVRPKCRVYKLTLEPGESVEASYPFFHLSVVLRPGRLRVRAGGAATWEQRLERADVAWREPVANVTKTNVGSTTIVEYIAEWC